MKTMKKAMALILAVLLLATSLAGCGSQTQEPTQDTTQESTATETSEGGRILGGKITIANPNPVATFFMPQSTSTGDQFAVQPALEQLGRVDEEGNTYPWLAEEFIVDEEALTLTIKLRDGVQFHDGSACDAEAVAWNIQQYIDNGKASEIGSPTQVTVEDPLTVKLQYETWANDWETVVGKVFICSKEAYEKNGEEWCKINMVGTGPFILTSYIADNSLSFVKNENYRIEGQPYIDELQIDIIADANTRFSAMMNNEVDLAMKFEDANMISSMEAAGFTSVGNKNANVADIKHIIWNSKNPDHPMGDLKVRQAIMHAIDWENVAKTLSGGLGSATPLFCTEDSWAYSPDAEFYTYDVELGKQMLAEAGYPDGFETTIYTQSQNQDTATVFQACLALLNIDAKVEILDKATLAAMQESDDIDGFIANRGASQMDFTSNYIRLYSSKGIKNHGIMLRPAEFEEPLFAAQAAKTVEEKKENLQLAAKALVQDYVMITPLSVVYYYAFAQNNIQDSGVYQCSLEQWTPEAICRTE